MCACRSTVYIYIHTVCIYIICIYVCDIICFMLWIFPDKPIQVFELWADSWTAAQDLWQILGHDQALNGDAVEQCP